MDAFALQKSITDWTATDFITGLEESMDKLNTGSAVIKIDKIELSVQANEKEDWRQAVSKEIVSQLTGQLNSQLSTGNSTDSGIVQKSRQDNLFEAIIHFFKYGTLPWWSEMKDQKNFIAEINNIIHSGMTAGMKTTIIELSREPDVRKRIVWQLPDEIFYKVMEAISPDTLSGASTVIDSLKYGFQHIPAAERKTLQVLLKTSVLETVLEDKMTNIETSIIDKLIEAAFGQGSVSSLQKALLKIDNQYFKEKFLQEKQKTALSGVEGAASPAKGKTKTAPPKKDTFKTTDKGIFSEQKPETSFTEGIYVNNAGLVITAGFLPMIFNKLSLSDGDTISDMNKAVCLVQYLASGREGIAEFELGLSKILCGIDMETPVDTTVHLTTVEKNEAKELLLSVIEYWAILKDTSAEGLQQSFLQRNGKLLFDNNEWLLQVEQKPYDMLLQNLPWNITITKLPWMKHMLKTEWIF